MGGTYDVYTHMTSGDRRPLWFHLDGEKMKQVAGHITGDWGTDDMQWFREKWQLEVPDANSHTIRLDTDGFFPHISAVLFSHADPDAPAVASEASEAADGVEDHAADEGIGVAGVEENITDGGMTELELENWAKKGFSAMTSDDRLLILSSPSSCGENFVKDRGMCLNNGGGGWAEYTLEIAPGSYSVFVHMTSGDSRPLQLHNDGEIVGEIAGDVTGGFGHDTMEWVACGCMLEVVSENVQEHTLKLGTDGFFPHVSALAFIKQ